MMCVIVEINGRIAASATVNNVSHLAELSDYDIGWSELASKVTGLPERSGFGQVRRHMRHQSVWALVERVAGAIMGKAP